jgi:hypothetical protein
MKRMRFGGQKMENKQNPCGTQRQGMQRLEMEIKNGKTGHRKLEKIFFAQG